MANRTRRGSERPSAAPPALTVPPEQLHREIDERVDEGQDLADAPIRTHEELRSRRQEYSTWTEYNKDLLRRSFDTVEPADDYSRGIGFAVVPAVPDPLLQQGKALRSDILDKIRRLRSLQKRLPLFVHPAAPVTAVAGPGASAGTEVFVVHGRDGEAKAAVQRFLSDLLGRDPVLLHEQADRGRTVIEKFEHHATQAGLAVVLLTGDDEGGTGAGPRLPRARQNVVLELGYFLGRLGRERVIILYDEDVELPSEIHGLLCVALDGHRAWRNALAREITAAGLAVDLAALLR